MRRILICFSILFCCHGLAGEPKFDWSSVLAIPPGSDLTGGNLILHFKSRNKPYWETEQGRFFVEKYLTEATQLTSDAEVLKFGSDSVKLEGLFIELGVCTGKTINFVAALNPHKKIYGFDSFEGLPEDWVRGDKVIPAGTFGFKNPNILPPVLHNVELIKGWFSDTLPTFIKDSDSNEPIAFLHLDSDIYSSTATAFEILGDRIQAGTILVFDELYNYPGYENHEFKALQEFLSTRNFKARYLAYNIYHEQVAIEIEANDCVHVKETEELIMLNHFTIEDLTQPLSPTVPTWNGSCGFCLEIKKDYDQMFRVHQLKMHAGIGTHMDAPSHRIQGGLSIGDIPVDQLVVPICLIDVSNRAEANYEISVQDIQEHEAEHGLIPSNSLVIGFTGWSRFWTDTEAYRNVDAKGQMHFPAFSAKAGELLLKRNVSGIAIDTLSPDCLDPDFTVHKLILGAGKYIIENVADCSKLPPRGSYAIALPLRAENSSESPMRLIALIPR